ncbi:hypothetical protein BCR42DRAFT_400618 [Absidia repens]|uniref:SAM domain-containing protein n=1 Tax=Absidia repens TaxID=90262 RepID=A0A1X2J1G5_9FUNG|nr:hypothetical protein BCR42DRAFT_400618 [Absidia repens]
MSRQSIYNQPQADLYSQSSSFGFKFPPSTSTEESMNKKPPVSAPTSLKNKHTENQARPESLQHRRTTPSPESQLLDKWSEDLQQYEMVLDSLVSTSLDNNVKEEIKHVDQWYRYLSETERTATAYALLQHSTPLQIRFFITVLQQLGKKDPVTSLLSPVYSEFDTTQMDPLSANSSYRDTINGDIHPTSNKNRRSYAFGEMDESLFQRQPYTSFKETGGVLGSSSTSSSSSGGRRLSDDFLDTPVSHQFSTPASSSNWSHRSMNTGLRTGNQDTSYSRHTDHRPKSADISHWSLSASPSHSNANNGNNHHQHQSFLPPPTATTLPVTPTSPTRLSWHGLPSLATNQFSDPVFCPPSIQQSNKRTSEIGHSLSGGPMDSITEKLNQWTLYSSSDLTSNGNNRQLPPRSQYNINRNNGNENMPPTNYHQVYPNNTAHQPSSSTSSTLPHTVHSNGKRAASGLRYYDIYDNDQKATALTKSNRQHDTKFTGMQQKDLQNAEEVHIRLLEDIPLWLKSLRLHKYTHIFQSMTWQTMVKLSDDDLKAKGVAALGARRKLLKVFDQVKNYCDKNNIKYDSV